jgi:hypothetical protein
MFVSDDKMGRLAGFVKAPFWQTFVAQHRRKLFSLAVRFFP